MILTMVILLTELSLIEYLITCSDKYTNLVQTSDGTSLNYDLANLNLKPALASIIHEQYKSVLKGRERLNLKGRRNE